MPMIWYNNKYLILFVQGIEHNDRMTIHVMYKTPEIYHSVW